MIFFMKELKKTHPMPLKTQKRFKSEYMGIRYDLFQDYSQSLSTWRSKIRKFYLNKGLKALKRYPHYKIIN